MKLDWGNARSLMHLANALSEHIETARKVVGGNVDATIVGRYFGDKLGPDEKRKLQDLAMGHVISEMWKTVKDLRDLYDVRFNDDLDSPIMLIHDLENMYKRLLDEAAADAPTT